MPLQVLQICVLKFIFLVLLPLATTSSITRTPDCLNRCGDVSIPYPFGVGSDCFLDASFNITCNTSTSPHKPYLKINNESIELVEIRVDNPPQIRIKYTNLLSGACYSETTGNLTWEDGIDITLSDTQYTVSEDNWLTAIGCDDLLGANTYIGEQTFRDACLGICMFEDYSVNGSCPNNEDGNSGGDGCCRIPIPKGSDQVRTGLTGLSKSWNSERVYPCSYAFVTEKGISNKTGFSYNFSLLRENPTAVMPHIPTVVRLDWRIGAENCSQARGNSTFACQDNTVCVDFGHNVQGYLCNCSQGYFGNPYLYQSCQDKKSSLERPVQLGVKREKIEDRVRITWQLESGQSDKKQARTEQNGGTARDGTEDPLLGGSQHSNRRANRRAAVEKHATWNPPRHSPSHPPRRILCNRSASVNAWKP